MISIQQVTEDLVVALKTVNNKVFPMLVKEGTNLPFITYERISISAPATKCGPGSLTTNFQVNIVSKEYLQGVSLLDSVINQVTRMSSSHSLKHYVTVTGASEEAYDDGYSQTLQLEIETTYGA